MSEAPENYTTLWSLMRSIVKAKEANISIDELVESVRAVSIGNEVDRYIELLFKSEDLNSDAGVMFALYLFAYRRGWERGIGGMTDEMFAYSKEETRKAFDLYDEDDRFKDELKLRALLTGVSALSDTF